MLLSAYDGQQRDIQRTIVVMTVVTTLMVACRLYIVWRNAKRFLWEDICVVVAYVWLIAFAVVVYIATIYGFGKHLIDIQSSGGNPKTAMKFFWLAQIFYTLCIGCTKLSFLALYHHVFGRADPSFRQCCLFSGFICLIWMVAYVLAALLQCTPVSRTWDRTVPGECFNFPAHRWSHAATNLATDLLILIIPIWPIRALQMPKTTRAGLFLVCSIGIFVCLITVLRMTTLPLTLTTKEPTWASAPTFLWSFIESGTGLMCLCLISFRGAIKAFSKWLGSMMTSVSRKGYLHGSFSNATRPKGAKHDKAHADASSGSYELADTTKGHKGGAGVTHDDAVSINGSEKGMLQGINRKIEYEVTRDDA